MGCRKSADFNCSVFGLLCRHRFCLLSRGSTEPAGSRSPLPLLCCRCPPHLVWLFGDLIVCGEHLWPERWRWYNHDHNCGDSDHEAFRLSDLPQPVAYGATHACAPAACADGASLMWCPCPPTSGALGPGAPRCGGGTLRGLMPPDKPPSPTCFPLTPRLPARAPCSPVGTASRLMISAGRLSERFVSPAAPAPPGGFPCPARWLHPVSVSA